MYKGVLDSRRVASNHSERTKMRNEQLPTLDPEPPLYMCGQCTHLKLGELSSLFIFYNITISWLYPLTSFWFYFLLCYSEKALLKLEFQQWSSMLLISGNFCKIPNFWWAQTMTYFSGVLVSLFIGTCETNDNISRVMHGASKNLLTKLSLNASKW